MPPAYTWLKMTAVYVTNSDPPSNFNSMTNSSHSGIGICVGGPALVQYLRPTDQELFDRFSTDIQQRSLDEGPRRAQEFDDYVKRLKGWSKSDKSSMFPWRTTR